ncbi:MAG: efflux RND transporter permease subunit [Comamonadaceae bacterium]|nr:efflux RND transporter permease subunit [Comamonadaceae bacterium]
MTPEEVEARITAPIETGAAGHPEPDASCAPRPSTRIADITVDFEDGTDIYWARSQVAERLASVARDLPAGRVGRTGADHHAAGRDVHVHRRGAICRWRNSARCSTG